MTGRIIIDSERCKGCRLCMVVCPKNCIVISSQSNKMGYLPAQASNFGCTGCAMCAVICPEAAIEVQREDDDAPAKPTKEHRLSLMKEKA